MFLSFVVQVWFKNRRAKVRQQQTHQNANARPARTATTATTTTSASRHSSSNNNNKPNANSSKLNTATNSLKLDGSSNATSGHLPHHGGGTTTANNNTATSNGLHTIAGHNVSPILPMTPTSSISPPANVICKKELNANNYHSSNAASLSDGMKSTSIHDPIKEEMNGMAGGNPMAAYSNINARLGHGGNSTPLGSNSSIMTTPSPPMTPQQNALYMPNPDYFWPPQYQQYPNVSYNPPAGYYSQVDYQSQANYNNIHSSYSASNMGFASSSNTFNGSMAAQPFGANGLDYMAQASDKYVNGMV